MKHPSFSTKGMIQKLLLSSSRQQQQQQRSSSFSHVSIPSILRTKNHHHHTISSVRSSSYLNHTPPYRFHSTTVVPTHHHDHPTTSSTSTLVPYPIVPKHEFGPHQEYSVIHTDRSLNLMSLPFQTVMKDLYHCFNHTYQAEHTIIIPGYVRHVCVVCVFSCVVGSLSGRSDLTVFNALVFHIPSKRRRNFFMIDLDPGRLVWKVWPVNLRIINIRWYYGMDGSVIVGQKYWI